MLQSVVVTDHGAYLQVTQPSVIGQWIEPQPAARVYFAVAGHVYAVISAVTHGFALDGIGWYAIIRI
jgi:hypothetical protein